MKPARFLLTVAALALTLVFSSVASTRAAIIIRTAPSAPAESRKLIKSVNVAAGSIVIQYLFDKSLHTYKIDDGTQLKVNGNPGKIADIKPGMEVSDYVERDSETLDSISLQGSGTPPATTKPKPKPKNPPTNSP